MPGTERKTGSRTPARDLSRFIAARLGAGEVRLEHVRDDRGGPDHLATEASSGDEDRLDEGCYIVEDRAPLSHRVQDLDVAPR